MVLLALYPERQFMIKLKEYKDQHILFAKRFGEYNNIKFEYYDSYEDVVRNSDVAVSAATVFNEDICPDDCFKEGVLLVPVHTKWIYKL